MTAPRPAYPDALESAWTRLALDALREPDAEALCTRLEPAVARLSDRFTTERAAGFGHYADVPEFLAAYGLFFFPQTFVRTRFALAECADRAPGILVPPGTGPFRVVDIGAGTGAAGLAAATFVAELLPDTPVRLTACDRSPASLDVLRRLAPEATGGAPAVAVETVVADGRTWDPPAGADLAVSSFALNEFFEDRTDDEAAAWISRILASLRPGGLLLVVEPATRTCATRLARLRDGIAGGHAHIVAPCPHAHPCPLLARGGESWCHEVRRWRPPDTAAWINRHLHRELQVLKFSFLALRRAVPERGTGEAGRGRLVAPLHETGGRIVTALCGGDGTAMAAEVLTRRMARAEVKEIVRTWERGDLVRFDTPAVIGAGRILRGAALAREFGFGA